MGKNKFRFLISLSPELTEELEEWESQGTHGKSDFFEDIGRQFFELPFQDTIMDNIKIKRVAKHMEGVDENIKGRIVSERKQEELATKNRLDNAMKSLHHAIYYIKDCDTGAYNRQIKTPSQQEIEIMVQNWVDNILPKEPYFIQTSFEEVLKEVKKLEDAIQLPDKKR